MGIKAPGGAIVRADTRRQARGARGRRPAQSLRHLLQSRRRAVHLRFRHGVGRRRALVSADAAGARHCPRRIRLAQRLVEVAELLPRQPAAAAGDGARLADRAGGLRPHHVPGRVPRRAVPLRLVAGPHPVHQDANRSRHLQGLERSLPRGQAAERHRHGGRPRRLAVFLHRRPRHRRGHLPRGLHRRRRTATQAGRHRPGGPPAAVQQRLCPRQNRRSAGRDEAGVGPAAHEPREGLRGPGQRPGAPPGADAPVRAVPHAFAAHSIVEGQAMRSPRQGRRPDGAARQRSDQGPARGAVGR